MYYNRFLALFIQTEFVYTLTNKFLLFTIHKFSSFLSNLYYLTNLSIYDKVSSNEFRFNSAYLNLSKYKSPTILTYYA
jgi:hypothetical protein